MSDTGPGIGASRSVSTGVELNMGLEDAIKSVKELNDQFTALSKTLTGMSANKSQLTSGVDAVVSSATGGGGSAYTVPQANVAGGGGAADSSGDLGWIKNIMGSGYGGSAAGTIASAAMMPISYGFNRIEENRMATRNLSYDLSRVSTMSGTGIEGILKMLANKTPVLGTAEEITGAMTQGASQGFFNMNDARSGSYYTSLRQMQQFTPDIRAPDLARTMSATLGNTRAQQTSMMLTGGAMGNIGAGGVPKTLSEWAESTLRWFEAQRPGSDRGKAFTKEELTSQVFPGSNMNAWMQRTGVSPEMQDYFWQYSIGKVQSGRDSKAVVKVEDIIAQRGGDLGLASRATDTAGARRDFTLASQEGLGGGTFYQQYLRRESTDRDFTNMMSQMIDKSLGKIMGGFIGSLFANIPTPIASLMMEQLQKLPTLIDDMMGNVQGNLGSAISGLAGKAGTAIGSAVGGPVGGMIGGVVGNVGGRLLGDPEFMIGDPGGYGPLGGTGTAGMTQDMARRVNMMMRANPNLRISSGFRDGALQGKLHRGGVGRTAPAGRSMHGKGLAADLGPASQFGWIAQNAGRFGLQSGQNHGEPWHVGFPGTVPIGDISDIIGGAASVMNPAGWFSGITGAGSSILDKIGGGISDILGSLSNFGSNLFQGSLGLMKGDWSALFGEGGAFDIPGMMSGALSGLTNLLGLPTILNPMALMSGKAGQGASAKDFAGAFGAMLGAGSATGGIIKPTLKSSMDWSSTVQQGGGGGGGLAGGPGGGVGVSGGVAQILQKYGGGKQVGAANVAGKEEAIRLALDAAWKAGFTGDELVAMGALAGRESGWNPRAHNPNRATGDDSYGLWQINMLGSMGPSRMKQFGITSYDQLLEPYTSGKAAFSLSGNGTNFSPWGGYKGKEMLYSAQQYVEPVYNLAKQWGMIGDPEFGGMDSYQPVAAGARINIHNSIAVTAGSNSTPASLRRTAEQLASFTTDEIYKQMARTT